MDSKSETPVRELDYRTNDGIEIRLLWNSLTDFVSVSVDDTRHGESFELDVAPEDAIDAFHHPYVYRNHDQAAHALASRATDQTEPERGRSLK